MKDLELQQLLEKLPRSSYFKVMRCLVCPNPHIVLFDDKDQPIAQMTLDQHCLDIINIAAEDIWTANRNETLQ